MAEVYMAGDVRNGTTFEMEGNVYKVVEFQHVKPGKGAAFVRTKLKNVITGAVIERTFNPSEKYPGAEIEKREMQYLYEDSDLYYFMDNETYEQIPLNKEQIGDALKYIKENMNVKMLSRMVENDFKLHGYDLVHSLGHGVGLDIHEYPYLHGKNDTLLKEKMVITNEPGLYVPGKFGVRIEDTVVITKSGSVNLTKSNKNYIVIEGK